MAKKRHPKHRGKIRPALDETLSDEELRVHRELQVLRAAGVSFGKRRAFGADPVRQAERDAWVNERFDKLADLG